MSVGRDDQEEGGEEHHGEAGEDEGPGVERGGEEDTGEAVMGRRLLEVILSIECYRPARKDEK